MEGDALSDIRGESVDTPSIVADAIAGDQPPESDNPWLDAATSILTAPFTAATAIITGAQDTAASVFGSGASVITGAQDTASDIAASVGGVYETVADRVVNPFSLAGLGLGLSTGAILTVVGLGVGTAAVADELFAAGAGRAVLFRRLSGARKR